MIPSTFNSDHAFAFLSGGWRVRHRKLKDRLVGSSEWLDFGGTCEAWELLGGAGNVDDNWLDDPGGAYRAVTLRRRDPETGQWSIWWLDQRFSGLGPPVHGGFENGIGTFFGDDTHAGRPVRVRFIWSGITGDEPKWEQAFSADGGASWETNWIMRFARHS